MRTSTNLAGTGIDAHLTWVPEHSARDLYEAQQLEASRREDIMEEVQNSPCFPSLQDFLCAALPISQRKLDEIMEATIERLYQERYGQHI